MDAISFTKTLRRAFLRGSAAIAAGSVAGGRGGTGSP